MEADPGMSMSVLMGTSVRAVTSPTRPRINVSPEEALFFLCHCRRIVQVDTSLSRLGFHCLRPKLYCIFLWAQFRNLVSLLDVSWFNSPNIRHYECGSLPFPYLLFPLPPNSSLQTGWDLNLPLEGRAPVAISCWQLRKQIRFSFHPAGNF